MTTVYALVDIRNDGAHALLGVYGSERLAQDQIDECRTDGFPNTAMWWEIQPVEVTE